MAFYHDGERFETTIIPLSRAVDRDKVMVSLERAPTAAESLSFFIMSMSHFATDKYSDAPHIVNMMSVGGVIRDLSGKRVNVGADLWWFKSDRYKVYAVDDHKNRGWGATGSAVGVLHLPHGLVERVYTIHV
jgi:hypothetical protein